MLVAQKQMLVKEKFSVWNEYLIISYCLYTDCIVSIHTEKLNDIGGIIAILYDWLNN